MVNGVWPPSASDSWRCPEQGGAAGKVGGGFLGWFPLVSFWIASTVHSQERGRDGARMGDAGWPGPWDAVCRTEGRGVREGKAGAKLGVQAPALLLAHGQVTPRSRSPSPDSTMWMGARGPGVPALSPGGVGVLAQPLGQVTQSCPKTGKQKPEGKNAVKELHLCQGKESAFFFLSKVLRR